MAMGINKYMKTSIFETYHKVIQHIINNIKVPQDVSIIGFNDLIASQYTIPHLITVSVHIENLASASVDLTVKKS